MLQTRLFHACAALARAMNRPVPKPTSEVPDVSTFLTKIGRQCSEHAELYENKWENLFMWDGPKLKEKGVPVQQRRYILRQVERLRQGEPVREIREGKKSFFGGERKRKETVAKWRAQQRQSA
ncbi:AaceriAAL054Wp [[Ashbya] aceris (nom. inval.)]|nr:AaceriAAL054Wp [[Ashbya] aceris (nom. inval.)]